MRSPADLSSPGSQNGEDRARARERCPPMRARRSPLLRTGAKRDVAWRRSMVRVVIVGAGFAGLNVAKRLGNAPGIRVTVIDRSNHHLFQPLLYQVAMAGLSPADIAAPIRSLLSSYTNIRVLMAEVTAIDLERKRV